MEKSIKRLCVMVNMIMLVLLKLFVHWCFWHIEVLLFFCHREKKKKMLQREKVFLVLLYHKYTICEYKKQYYVCKYNYLSKHGVHLFAFLKDKTVIFKNSCKCYAIQPSSSSMIVISIMCILRKAMIFFQF